jgi:hypothetical protein
MNRVIPNACLAFALAFTADIGAQETPQNPPTPCQDNQAFDQWDFWVGEWNVYGNDEERALAGTNSITKHYANCLITETWKSAGGGGGFSINYYNPVKGQWRQVWVSNGYSIDYTGGLNDQGQMVLEGEIDYYGKNNSAPFRGIWTPRDNGDVVQRFEVFDAEKDQWNVWFEGLYVKR